MILTKGLKVRVKSIDWYNENKDESGCVRIGYSFVPEMSEFCGRIVTVRNIANDDFTIEEDIYSWNVAFVEQLEATPPVVEDKGDFLVIHHREQKLVIEKEFALELTLKIAEKLC